MVKNIIDTINETLCTCFKGAEIFGLTFLDRRDNLTIPVVIGKAGENSPVVVDDTKPFVIYHRLNNISSSLQTGTQGRSYGDSIGAYANVFQLSLYVYARDLGEMPQDQIFMNAQANMTGQLKVEPFKSVSVTVTGANLNSALVWNAEYTSNTENRLPTNNALMQINYSITALIDTNCFKCNC